jgi:hypothetical protein
MRRAVPVTGKKFDWDGPVGIIRWIRYIKNFIHS